LTGHKNGISILFDCIIKMTEKRPREGEELPDAKKPKLAYPTLEEFYKNSELQLRWGCIVCGGPALEGSMQPGRLCSIQCGIIKYS
jgi:hypothetical protein